MNIECEYFADRRGNRAHVRDLYTVVVESLVKRSRQTRSPHAAYSRYACIILQHYNSTFIYSVYDVWTPSYSKHGAVAQTDPTGEVSSRSTTVSAREWPPPCKGQVGRRRVAPRVWKVRAHGGAALGCEGKGRGRDCTGRGPD